MAQVLTPEDRRRYELLWAAEAVVKPDLPAWQSYRYTSRLHAYLNKILLVWQYSNGQPEVLEVLRVQDIGLGFTTGLSVKLTRKDGSLVTVNNLPSKLPGLDVFIWLPALGEVRFTPSEWDNPRSPRTIRFGLNFKQKRNPVDGPEAGQHYLSELTGFRRMWPAFSDIRF